MKVADAKLENYRHSELYSAATNPTCRSRSLSGDNPPGASEECHNVKNVGKGPWGILGDMKTDRPRSRFWFVALSGTILNANPSDIAGQMDIIVRKAWTTREHPYYPFSGEELKRSGRGVDKSVEEQEDPTVQALAQQRIKTFGRTET